jgi:hypothetical protein
MALFRNESGLQAVEGELKQGVAIQAEWTGDPSERLGHGERAEHERIVGG